MHIHTCTHTVCKHRKFSGLVNFKSPASPAYHKIDKRRREFFETPPSYFGNLPLESRNYWVRDAFRFVYRLKIVSQLHGNY